MKKLSIAFFIIILLNYNGKSQENNVLKRSAHVSYFGENITHYGLSIGQDYSFINKVKQKKSSFRLNQIYGGYIFSGFNHPGNQSVFSFFPEVGYRFTHNNNWYWQINGGFGLLRSFYSGKTYQPAENGFENIPLAGKWSYGSIYSIGVGKSVSKSKNIFLFTKINVINEFNYNQKILFRPVLQFGLFKRY